MRRFLTLISLLCLALPAGISISGCYKNPEAKYCSIPGYGLKTTDVASITLQPQTTGISLSFGQTQQISTPTATTCTGDTASVSAWTYGTTNNKLVDITPSGLICAGTWNRNSGGGIADYTTCSKPNPLPTTDGLPYSSAYITASASSVTSNTVKVFVHTQATSVSMIGSSADLSSSLSKCYSQSATAQLDSQACYSDGSGNQVQLCAPAGTTNFACKTTEGVTYPTCSSALGALTYSLGNSTIGSINSETNVITALLPGTTSMTTTIAGTASSSGYFSVCAPQYITLKTAAGGTSATVTQGVTQTLTAASEDTKGATLTGLSLSYMSTNPIDITVNSGSITASYPGVATVYASCQPPTCNPSPINELGLYSTGLATSSNPVTITTPGTTSDYVWFGAPNDSQYFSSVSLLSGTSGSTVKLPYVPNSMVMDKTGTSLYFGSSHALMVYSTSSNTSTKVDGSVPGVVLAVSPDNSYAIINDQSRGILYLYNISAGSAQTQSGYGAAAGWTADSKTLYIVDSASLNTATVKGHTDALYVYSTNTGWSTCLPGNACAGDFSGAWSVATTIPGIGAYLGGPQTTARAWCPFGTVGSSASMIFYPQADLQPVKNDVLAATTDGGHILGATQTSSGIVLTDLGITIPTQSVTNGNTVTPPVACSNVASGSGSAAEQKLSGLSFASSYKQTPALSLASTAVNQVVTSPVSNLTFITYKAGSANTGAKLPFYIPSTAAFSASTPVTLGTYDYVTLSGSSSISAPVAGAFSPDNSLFFVSTAGDNLVHEINIPTSVSVSNPPTDAKKSLTPALPACSKSTDDGCTYEGTGIVPATVITVIPRATT